MRVVWNNFQISSLRCQGDGIATDNNVVCKRNRFDREDDDFSFVFQII